jgi:UDP-GlcNAc3NAcA epimerase
VDNLNQEAIGSWGADDKVILSGDVMQDGVLFYADFAQKPATLDIASDFILSTIHRAENTDDDARLRNIVSALNEIAETVQVILPLHPRTKQILSKLSAIVLSKNLTVIDPVGYLNMVYLIQHCSKVMTDSRGLQKEAFFFKKPCITLRDETEWLELIENDFNILVGAYEKAIQHAFFNAEFSTDFDKELYGGGHASDRIVGELILNYL